MTSIIFFPPQVLPKTSQRFDIVTQYFPFFQIMVSILQSVVRKHLGDEIPPVYELSKNVSFILQNSHFSVSYPRAFMPNVAEIACIHCKPAQPLPNVSSKEVLCNINNMTFSCLRTWKTSSQAPVILDSFM